MLLKSFRAIGSETKSSLCLSVASSFSLQNFQILPGDKHVLSHLEPLDVGSHFNSFGLSAVREIS